MAHPTKQLFGAALALCTCLLSGCGPVLGDRVDFGSQYKLIEDNPHMQALAGKTFYITNKEDYQNLVELKAELVRLMNSPFPSLFTRRNVEARIYDITSKYNSGFLGLVYPWN